LTASLADGIAFNPVAIMEWAERPAAAFCLLFAASTPPATTSTIERLQTFRGKWSDSAAPFFP